jgi:hypothetical protein
MFTSQKKLNMRIDNVAIANNFSCFKRCGSQFHTTFLEKHIFKNHKPKSLRDESYNVKVLSHRETLQIMILIL